MHNRRSFLVASPAVAIALLGLAHPLFLTPATAARWQVVHLALLPLFPLLAGSLLWLLRSEWGPLGWAARVAAYGYAVLYGALDSIAGIGAPQQVRHAASPPIGALYDVGDRLGHAGVYCLALSAVLTSWLLHRRGGSRMAILGGAVVAIGCVPFYRHHIFPLRGVLGVATIAVGLALLARVSDPETAT